MHIINFAIRNMEEVAMKALATILIAAVLPATSASAQFTITTAPQQTSTSAFGVDPIMRVTTPFRTTVETAPQAAPDATAQETARRVLYGMAERECAPLSEIFKAECRLSSIQISFPVVTANAPPSNVMTATAVYELKPKGSALGR
jgi:hypothetical protein